MPYKVLVWIFHQRWLTRFRKVHDWLMNGFEKHANQGHGDAQELFGFLLLYKGSGHLSKASGVRYLNMCASAERPKAAWHLYQVYQKGFVSGVPADLPKAKEFLAMAKQGEYPLALEVS